MAHFTFFYVLCDKLIEFDAITNQRDDKFSEVGRPTQLESAA